MKCTALLSLFFFLSLLFFAFATPGDPEYVYDIEGKALQKDGVYRILATDETYISLAAIPNSSKCELALVNTEKTSPYTTAIGTPESVDYINTDIPVTFTIANNPPKCAQSADWVAVQHPLSSPFLMIGTAEQHEGGIDVNGYFRIAKQTGNHVYKLMFCPEFTPDTCTDVGTKVTSTEKRRRLALVAGNPLPVRFEKASAISMVA